RADVGASPAARDDVGDRADVDVGDRRNPRTGGRLDRGDGGRHAVRALRAHGRGDGRGSGYLDTTARIRAKIVDRGRMSRDMRYPRVLVIRHAGTVHREPMGIPSGIRSKATFTFLALAQTTMH